MQKQKCVLFVSSNVRILPVEVGEVFAECSVLFLCFYKFWRITHHPKLFRRIEAEPVKWPSTEKFRFILCTLFFVFEKVVQVCDVAV